VIHSETRRRRQFLDPAFVGESKRPHKNRIPGDRVDSAKEIQPQDQMWRFQHQMRNFPHVGYVSVEVQQLVQQRSWNRQTPSWRHVNHTLAPIWVAELFSTWDPNRNGPLCRRNRALCRILLKKH